MAFRARSASRRSDSTSSLSSPPSLEHDNESPHNLPYMPTPTSHTVLSGASASSMLMEYSSTDDDPQDYYFEPRGQQQQQPHSNFGYRPDTGTMRVMRYRRQSSSSLDQPQPQPQQQQQQNSDRKDSNDDDASNELDEEHGGAHHDTAALAQQQEKKRRKHKPSRSVSSLSADDHQHGSSNNWVAKLAFGFRSASPRPNQHKTASPSSSTHSNDSVVDDDNDGGGGEADDGGATTKRNSRHRRQHSYQLQEYPYTPTTMSELFYSDDFMNDDEMHRRQQRSNSAHEYDYNDETAPLIRNNSINVPQQRRTMEPITTTHPLHFVHLAAAFLHDYESNRPATLSTRLDSITPTQLELHKIRFSTWFSILRGLATLALFLASCLEGFAPHPHHGVALTCLNLTAVLVFMVDMVLARQSLPHKLLPSAMPNQTNEKIAGGTGIISAARPSFSRTTRAEQLAQPLILLGIMLSIENVARLVVTAPTTRGMVLLTSVFKPLVLFYVSSQARDAVEALRRILKVVMRVLLVELLLILMFAAVACRLFRHYEQFHDLSTAWLSLFELSTTVVNPSMWMPMYQETKTSAIFFCAFVITMVFYLHSLVLSVVFQTYIQAASEIHERTAADREDVVQLAYAALRRQQKGQSTAASSQGPQSEGRQHEISIDLVRETLQFVRPHYSTLKIQALVEIVDPSDHQFVDYPTFRTKIRQALNASIRTARNATTLAMSIELIAVAVAMANFIYVILVSSTFDAHWFVCSQELVGTFITLVALFEVLVRFNPLRIPDFTPLTRLNATFDGLALIAALISCCGIIMWLAQQSYAIECILMGRAVDMVRIMRFFQIFRDVVKRSSDVLPALVGPIILVLTTLHLFVYLGMALWGDAIHVGMYEGKITPLYDLNNFNSYQEGMVTMFQVLVVNDWHAIAHVFLYADRCSSVYVVYPFFVVGNLICVSVMLNVLTAFFVESFTTRLEAQPSEEHAESQTTKQKEREFMIQHSATSSLRRKTSASIRGSDDIRADHDDSSVNSSDSEFFEFDVFERAGLDKIMQTVAGSSHSSELAQQVCTYLEVFEGLSPGRETVGYLVCDQQTLERYGNQRFKAKSVGFLEENGLHVAVSDMHAELLALSSRPTFDSRRSLIRKFARQDGDPNSVFELSASLLRRHPALSLFVSRVRDSGEGRSHVKFAEGSRS